MKRLVIYTLLGLLIMAMSQCSNAQDPVYTYADGSANVYIIRNDTIFYKPMTPEMSSSGTYSGGDPVQKALHGNEYEQIQALLDRAIGNPKVHIDDRVMQSGMITNR